MNPACCCAEEKNETELGGGHIPNINVERLLFFGQNVNSSVTR